MENKDLVAKIINKEFEKVLEELQNECRNSGEISTVKKATICFDSINWDLFMRVRNFYGDYLKEVEKVVKGSKTIEQVKFPTDRKDIYEKMKKQGWQRKIERELQELQDATKAIKENKTSKQRRM